MDLPRVAVRLVALSIFSLFLAACGGGSGGSSGGSGGGGGGATQYTVSVSVSGLTGTGMVVGISSSDPSNAETVSVPSSGTYTFPTALNSGSLYSVGIATQPSGQNCTLSSNAGGTIGTSNVTVTATCINTYTVGGSVTGLSSGNVQLMLNGGPTVTVNSNSSFTFSTPVSSGSDYAVTIFNQPAGQTCLATGSWGKVGSANITNVSVTCAASGSGYTVGGTVSGMSGLLVLDLNGVEQVPLTYNGTFNFWTKLATGAAYNVTVAQQPTNQTCSVGSGSGTMGSSNYPFVSVTCVTSPTAPVYLQIDASSAGLSSGDTVTLTLNGTENQSVDEFSFAYDYFSTPLYDGDSYQVTVTSNPTGRLCYVEGGAGKITGGVTPSPVYLYCDYTSNTYTVGGSVTGLSTSGLVLDLNGTQDLAITSGASSYTFANALPDNANVTVSIKQQPTGQVCSISPTYGTISGANLSNFNVICSNGPYTVGGYVGTLTGSGLTLALNGGDILPVSTSGNFTFSTALSTGMGYDVTVASQPSGQNCVVQRGQGAISSSSVSDIYVSCGTQQYSVAVNVDGYNSSTPLELQLNGGEILSLSSNTDYTSQSPTAFTTLLESGDTYDVGIVAQPTGQWCTLTNAIGTIGTSNVTSIGAVCVSPSASTGPYTVSATVSGLQGTGLTLQLNGGNDLTVSTDGYATFSTTLADTTAYTVSVLNQPTGPIQKCQVSNGSGTVSGANVVDVTVSCGNAVSPLYPVNGSRWLDYVKNDGATTIGASDTACAPASDGPSYDACLNGGEYREVDLAGVPSCTGVTASDNLNAFNWTCDASTGTVRVVSTGLKSGVTLSDLMDFTTGRFKEDFVTVNENGPTDTTQSAVWWSNTVRINNTGASYCCIYNNDINLVTDNAPSVYSMPSNSALLVEPGMAITGYPGSKDLVKAGSQNFLWFEGTINPSASDGGFLINWTGTKFSVIQSATASNGAAYGIYMKGSKDLLNNVTANGNNGYGLDLYGGDFTLSGVTASNNTGGVAGIEMYATSNTLTNVTANGNSGIGINFDYPVAMTLNGVTADNNTQDGIVMANVSSAISGATVSNVAANGNGGIGVHLVKLTSGQVSNITAKNNSTSGIVLGGGNGSTATNLVSVGNGKVGTKVGNWTAGTVENITSSTNGTRGVNLLTSERTAFRNIVSANNGGDGILVGSDNNSVFTNLTTVNNGGMGVDDQGESNAVVLDLTVANNASYGMGLGSVTGNGYSSLLSANNGSDGLNTDSYTDYLTFADSVSANNQGYGISLGSDYGYYTGLLEVGSNVSGDCYVSSTTLVSPGLAQVPGTGKTLTNTCQDANASDATIYSSINLANSVIGKVTTTDTTNADDTNGTALYDNIGDWTSFDNASRTWGKDGLAFADASNDGACLTSGETCRIWDWSVANADTGNSGSPALWNVLSLPSTGNEVLTHTWYNDLGIAGQSGCDTYFPGSVWNSTASSCTTTYLRHAVEIAGDGIGNDNGLCESGETCLYTPDIGSFQGYGSLVSAGTISTGGTLQNITLMEYANTGR